MALEGNEELLLADHSGLVRSVVKRFATIGASVGLDFDDLKSVGNLGLLMAIRRFDPSRGFAFSTYAGPCVRGHVLTEINRVRWGSQHYYSESDPVMCQGNGEREPEDEGRNSPLDVLIQKEEVARVHDAMDKAGRGGEIVRLRFIEGVEPAELKERFSRGNFWVTKQIHKGIGEMQKVLEPSLEHRSICLSGLYSRVR